ncbi:MAG TPA: GTP-binding protein [Acidimicrobiales bacterium]|nr:GTP-binding protein [Acidimicrobiales bacterium]
MTSLADAGLLRVATAGSVDDGKSTLIGRLLWDAKAILEDQVAAVTHASRARGHDGVHLAMLTDGLRAERDQGITIDVAYRYFATPRRRFVLTDTPGHFEYTRNMVTGASNADLAVVLVDARNGVLEQTRRHAVIASMLHLPHVVVAVNKMDLVGWDQAVFTRICEELTAFVNRFDEPSLTFIPMSAKLGDNVVEPSANMPWYDGPPLLTYLEEVPLDDRAPTLGARLPVQVVLPGDPPGLAGQVVAGVLRTGDDVVVLPAGVPGTIAAIETPAGPVREASAGDAVTLRLAGDVPATRGDMVSLLGAEPMVDRHLEALLCWMSDEPLVAGARYALKHTSRWCSAVVDELRYRLDIESLEHAGARSLRPNDIGGVSLRLDAELAFDAYRNNRATGSFILVDETTHVTVAAGMIVGRLAATLERALPTAG